MKNNKSSDNTLIKRNNLLALLKSYGINRISPRALKKIDLLIRKEIEEMGIVLKEIIVIKGRKTLLEEDIEDIVSKKEIKEYPEI
ncbi:MAG: hypothetical protein AABX85_03775 [Nanoarchaeota archaeon]